MVAVETAVVSQLATGSHNFLLMSIAAAAAAADVRVWFYRQAHEVKGRGCVC